MALVGRRWGLYLAHGFLRWGDASLDLVSWSNDVCNTLLRHLVETFWLLASQWCCSPVTWIALDRQWLLEGRPCLAGQIACTCDSLTALQKQPEAQWVSGTSLSEAKASIAQDLVPQGLAGCKFASLKNEIAAVEERRSRLRGFPLGQHVHWPCGPPHSWGTPAGKTLLDRLSVWRVLEADRILRDSLESSIIAGEKHWYLNFEMLVNVWRQVCQTDPHLRSLNIAYLLLSGTSYERASINWCQRGHSSLHIAEECRNLPGVCTHTREPGPLCHGVCWSTEAGHQQVPCQR